MAGDGLSFPVNPDAGGESARDEWAGAVAPEQLAQLEHALMYPGEHARGHSYPLSQPSTTSNPFPGATARLRAHLGADMV